MCGQCDADERRDNEEFKAGELKREAQVFLTSLPRKVRTCEWRYPLALALSREGLVTLTGRTVLGNNQVRYDVARARPIPNA